MKKRVVFLLAILTMLVLLTVGLAVGASADTIDVAADGDLAAAIEGASDGDVINITEDISVDASITITKTITITSENGSTVTATVDNLFNVGSDANTSGNLTIDGNLTIAYPDKGTIVRMVNGTLTVQGSAKLTSGWTAIRMASDGGLVANCYVYIKDNAVVEATSTTEDDNVIYVNDGTRANLYIQGGTVRHTAGRGISFPAGKITVSGGTLTAKYGIYVWYAANSAAKSITVSGGTVNGSITGIYFNTNAKHCALTVSGGTVSGNTHAIDYRADQTSADNSISISGGTVTAPGQTMFFQRCTALTVNVTGGTIEATNGGLTIYGAELRGDLTFNISGTSTRITATGDNTFQITSGNTSTYPGKPVVTIDDGIVSAGGEHALNIMNGNFTINGGTISASSIAIYGNRNGGKVTITGGTVTASSKTIAFQGADNSTISIELNISGTAQVLATGDNAIWFVNNSSKNGFVGGTINISGGKVSAASSTIFLHRSNAVTLNVTGGTIEATTGGNTIYCAEPKGNITLNLSGTAQITAATESAMVVTGTSNTYPGKLVATIEGGTVTAATWPINVKSGTVTVKGGEIRSTTGAAIYANKVGSKVTVTGGTIVSEGSSAFEINGSDTNTALTISGGTIIFGGSNASAMIANVGDAKPTIKITAGLLVNSNESSTKIVDSFASGTVEITGGKFLYKDSVQTLCDGKAAPKTAQVSYDWNGDQVFDIFYTYFSISATSNRYSGAMEKGAAVRIAGDKTALKFTAVYSADIVRNLNNKAESGSTTTYGMLILPTEQLASLNAFDAESLAGLLTSQGLVHLVGGQNAHLKTDADGNVILQGAIFDLPDVTVSYSAISYVCLASRYEINYYFTAYNPADNARSAEDVAQAALDDADGGYTAEQITVLQSYIPQQQPQQVNAFKKEDDLVFVAPCKEF